MSDLEIPPFSERLEDAVQRAGNPCLVGIDPHPDLLPAEFSSVRDSAAPRAERARRMADFACEAIELLAGRVAAVKLQSAFFELLGADGAAAWERVVRAAHLSGLLVIGDVKRGDIGSTATAYARAFLEEGLRERTACDAITVNPLFGTDAMMPFIQVSRRTGGGLYVLVRTSNPDGAMFQAHGAPPLSELVARAVVRWGSELVGANGLSSVGAVVGATNRGELARLRALMPSTPFLMPGYGAQGAGPEDIAAGFLPGARGALVSSSREILFAHRSPQFAELGWQDALREALKSMIAAVREAVRLSVA